jgi:hypothetical protein
MLLKKLRIEIEIRNFIEQLCCSRNYEFLILLMGFAHNKKLEISNFAYGLCP